MKKFILLQSCVFLFANVCFAQPVGIGTTIPAFQLDVKNGSINTDAAYRIKGNRLLVADNDGGNTFLGVQNVEQTVNVNSYSNTALGFSAFFPPNTTNIVGSGNTATGVYALDGTSLGGYNVANGANALRSNLHGDDNTAIGVNALRSNKSGHLNTATGSGALYYNTNSFSTPSGSYNTANGTNALYNHTTGNHNTANGFYASYFNSLGDRNTAVGVLALYLTTNGSYNTAVGHEAGKVFDLGFNNTLIGAGANLSFDGQYNSIAIGNLATAPGNSTVRIGNSVNWSYGGYANWTNISDGRYKKNIKDNVAGLEFILKLRPVTYQMDVTSLHQKLNEGYKRDLDETMKMVIAEKEKMIWTGFLAQQVEASANETGFVFSGVDKPRNANGVYGLRYDEFVVPLVKAVQELSAKNNALLKEIAALKSAATNAASQQKKIEALTEHVEKLEQLLLAKNKLTFAGKAIGRGTGHILNNLSGGQSFGVVDQ